MKANAVAALARFESYSWKPLLFCAYSAVERLPSNNLDPVKVPFVIRGTVFWLDF